MLGLAVKEGLPLVTVMVWDESCLRPPSSEASRTAALSSKYRLYLEQRSLSCGFGSYIP